MKAMLEKLSLPHFTLVLASMLALVTTGCNNDDDEQVVPEPPAVSYVSLYHVSPNAPALNVFLDNQRVNYNPLQYAGFTSYLNFYAGQRNLRVSPFNADNVIIDTTLTFAQGQPYSLFYVNRIANIEALLVKDSLVNPGVGKAAVRFIHLSPDAPPVTVTRNDQNAVPLFGNQAYLQASPFRVVDSGVQSFLVKANATTILSIPEVNLLPGGVYTIVARGFLTPPPGNNNVLGAQLILNN